MPIECNPPPIANEEGIFNSSGADPHPLDKPLDLSWLVTEGRRAYAKRTASKNKSPATIQLALF
jgi:hypothetical protein